MSSDEEPSNPLIDRLRSPDSAAWGEAFAGTTLAISMSTPVSLSAGASHTSLVPSIWETYICAEPAVELPLLIRNGPDEYTALLRTLQRSADHFSERDQMRVVELIQFEQAKLHMQHGQWKHAMRVLLPLWQTLSWRKSGWWHLLEEVDYALQDCAGCVQDPETLVAVQWELLNQFSVGFAFESLEGSVGVSLASQLVISSYAQPASEPITIREVKIRFEGGLRDIRIEHCASEAPTDNDRGEETRLQQVHLRIPPSDDGIVPLSPISPSSRGSLSGLADMTLVAGCTTILAFTDVPRHAGEVEVSSIMSIIQGKNFDLEIIATDDEHMQQDCLFLEGSKRVPSRRSLEGRSNAIRILPKPPKLRLEIAGLEKESYINETMMFIVDVTNEEEDEADIHLDIRVLGNSAEPPVISWLSDDDNSNPLEIADPGGRIDMRKHIESFPPSAKQQHKVHLQSPPHPAEYVLEIRARYYLRSALETPILKTTTAGLVFRQPFEVISSFTPTIRPEPWPNYFEIDDREDKTNSGIENDLIAQGLVQSWSLISRMTSVAMAPLAIERVEPRVTQVQEAARCTITDADADSLKHCTILPGDVQERHFGVDVQKVDLEDRRPTFVDIHLEVTWRREGSTGPANVIHLPIPELAVPFGEPRVLASARNGSRPLGVIHLDYIIENPSIYTLTFTLTMETSEEFAFSGVKSVTVQLVPLSRHFARYNLLPLVKGAWISPQLRVYDIQFQKTLKVNGTEGMRNDRKGVSVWVDADG
ncbi:MAG: hypothetical protein Q9163_004348 [Psora crenata]